jgi:hypothetical protein
MTDMSKPRIKVGSPPATIRAITAAIDSGKIPDLFVSDGRIVHIGEISGSASAIAGGADEDSPLPVTATQIGPAELAALLASSTYTYTVKVGKDGKDGKELEEEVTPPPNLLKAALAPKKWNLNASLGIAGAPILRPDGTLLQDPGYDKQTGLYLASKIPLDKVPEHPTKKQVEDARSFILDSFLYDFPWVDEADRANYVGVLVTPILRKFMNSLIPFVVYTATMPSSGKSILTGGPGMLYGQRVLTWPDGEGSDAELRKSITAVLADPAGTVIFDNLAEGTVIRSPVLANLITTRAWSDRLLGGNVTASHANDRLWCATGNNLQLGGDMATRTVMIRLDPDMPRPEERPPETFAIPNLDQWIMEPANQRRVLWNLLVLVLDWTGHGHPKAPGAPMRQFTDWARNIGGFLDYHGIKGFLTNVESVRGNDDDAAIWGAFLARWHSRHGGRWLTTNELRLDADVPLGYVDPWDGLFIQDGRGKIPNAQSLGMRLKGQGGRPRMAAGCWYTLRCSSGTQSGNVRTWQVEERPA